MKHRKDGGWRLSPGMEDLRDREGAGLSNMMSASRTIRMNWRTWPGLRQTLWESLSRIEAVLESNEYQALGTIVKALDKISYAGLQMASRRTSTDAADGSRTLIVCFLWLLIYL